MVQSGAPKSLEKLFQTHKGKKTKPLQNYTDSTTLSTFTEDGGYCVGRTGNSLSTTIRAKSLIRKPMWKHRNTNSKIVKYLKWEKFWKMPLIFRKAYDNKAKTCMGIKQVGEGVNWAKSHALRKIARSKNETNKQKKPFLRESKKSTLFFLVVAQNLLSKHERARSLLIIDATRKKAFFFCSQILSEIQHPFLRFVEF